MFLKLCQPPIVNWKKKMLPLVVMHIPKGIRLFKKHSPRRYVHFIYNIKNKWVYKVSSFLICKLFSFLCIIRSRFVFNNGSSFKQNHKWCPALCIQRRTDTFSMLPDTHSNHPARIIKNSYFVSPLTMVGAWPVEFL